MDVNNKPLVTLILPVFNEEKILNQNLEIIYAETQKLKELYYWEIIIINDGSTDSTPTLLKSFIDKHPNVRVYHHIKNQGLGKALQNGLAHSKGDYVITYDVDLSYSISLLKALLDKITTTKAQIVMASPYMKGGGINKVPFYRKVLSIGANKFLSTFTKKDLSCLTCMVRAYDGHFIRSLNLRSEGKEIMQEIVHKTLILKGDIIEIPAQLNWQGIQTQSPRKINKKEILEHTSATLVRGFLLRPVVFFIVPGLILFIFSLYPNYWMINHVITEYPAIETGSFLDRWSQALAIAYPKHPHTFHTGLLTLLMSIQLLALGFHSLQQKHTYEELFVLGTKLNRRLK